MAHTNLNAQNDLVKLNDDFDHVGSLGDWLTHHQTENWPSFIERAKIIETENVLFVEPKSTAWFNEFHRGPFFFKPVDGNFTVTTRVKVTGKSSNSPRKSYSLAGLMIRAPRSQGIDKNVKKHENWMFLSTGSATKKGKPQFESKDTVKGKSKLKVFPSKQGWINISISRIGNTFYQTYRYDNDTVWTLLRVIERNDMPDEVQVGMLAYTDFWSVAFKYLFNPKKYNTKPIKGNPDLIAKFDFMHFNRIDKSAAKLDCNTGFHLTEISETEKKVLKLE